MTVITARYDGKVLVPDQPINLPVGSQVEVHLREPHAPAPAALGKLAQIAGQFPENPALPSDGAAQHDHYLHGSPKQP
jgi:hypothetical protein